MLIWLQVRLDARCADQRSDKNLRIPTNWGSCKHVEIISHASCTGKWFHVSEQACDESQVVHKQYVSLCAYGQLLRCYTMYINTSTIMQIHSLLQTLFTCVEHSERISPRLAPLTARLPMSWSWDCLAGPLFLAEFRGGREISSAGPA